MQILSTCTVPLTMVSMLIAGCAQNGAAGSTKPDNGAGTAVHNSRVGPGMGANGEVVDPTKVESGYGQKVKGINDFEGEITGIPVPGSKFTQLQIGMGMKQVVDIAGAPTDQGAYMTGKAFIPFYFGGDRSRSEFIYKGEGRLIFAGGSIGDLTGGNLVWIINSAAETGYR
jgi:hypothetical protein